MSEENRATTEQEMQTAGSGAEQEMKHTEGRPQTGEPPKRRAVGVDKPRIPYPVFGAASAIYALFYTFCLYRNASGITYPFFVAGTLCYLFFCMKKCGVPSGSSADIAADESGRESGVRHLTGVKERAVLTFYVVSLMLLGISVCLSDDWKVHAMTKTGIFLLAISLALRCFYVTSGWSFSRYLSAICRSLLEMLHYIDTPFADAVVFFGERNGEKKNGKVKYVLLGVVIAVPLLIVILALLLSADAVFAELFDKLLGGLDLGTLLLICVMALAVYLFSYSFVRGLITYRMPSKPAKEKNGEPAAAITFTSLIAVIYLIFCCIQVVYLFAGKMQLPEGLTWAAYARQGFFQLLFVCLINLVMVLVCLALFKESRILKAILAAISLMTYILIASSAFRMMLYIRNYYMTFLRLFVLWALAVIGILFAGVIISIYKKDFPLFGYSTVVVTVCYLVFAFAKPDYQVAKYDLAAVVYEKEAPAETGSRAGFEDYWYLADLSLDAAPLMTQESVREMMESSNAVQYYYDKVRKRTKDMGLRNFNFSRWRAKACMEAGKW